jgi:hypothetical protein
MVNESNGSHSLNLGLELNGIRIRIKSASSNVESRFHYVAVIVITVPQVRFVLNSKRTMSPILSACSEVILTMRYCVDCDGKRKNDFRISR